MKPWRLHVEFALTLGPEEDGEREVDIGSQAERADPTVPPLGFQPTYSEPTYQEDR